MKISRVHTIAWRICVVFITLFITVFFFTVVFAGIADETSAHGYTDTLFMWLLYTTPVCVLLTLIRTLHVSNTIWMNLLIVAGTVCGAFIITFFMTMVVFVFVMRNLCI